MKHRIRPTIEKRFSIVFIMMFISFFAQAQTKSLQASYSCEMKIPQNINKIEDEGIRALAISKLKEKNQTFALYFCDEVYGFAPILNAFTEDKFIVSGENSVYLNMKTKEKLSQEMILDKPFVVKELLDSINWTIGEETKTILNKVCKRATISINNIIITAWFCEDIPLQVGPLGFYGLPGLILELEKGSSVYSIQEVKFVNTSFEIVPPSKGKVLAREKFIELEAKKMKELGADKAKSGDVIIIR